MMQLLMYVEVRLGNLILESNQKGGIELETMRGGLGGAPHILHLLVFRRHFRKFHR